MQFRHLEVFYAIYRTGSVTEAAQLLNVTQPAVSTVLKHAETRLKFKLFERVAGRLKPTPEALAILPDVRILFERLDSIERLTRDLAGGTLGAVSLAAAFPIAYGLVSRAVAGFVATRPDMQVLLHSLTPSQVLDRVVSQEVELGMLYGPVHNQALDVEPLGHVEIVCVVPRDHPLAGLGCVEMAQLAEHRLITYLPQSALWPWVDRALSEAGVAPKIQVHVSMSSAGIQLARLGVGVALVESTLVRAMPFGDLVAVPLHPVIDIETVMVSNPSVPKSEAMLAFMAQLRLTAQRGE
ncbi:LysR family transcriptional regulator [Verticiella sediminum]|uniref:LysR family transcriptional regulator n=1 Tax=Verticiella sediminum TaxID=1247510 RepID=A0A556A7D9_9BURK|nr:LysR family transcriptional regulator [Verticiella sediminum]TSH88807.1 LysR family transcriptional regulator [Verticiella sediminum]